MYVMGNACRVSHATFIGGKQIARSICFPDLFKEIHMRGTHVILGLEFKQLEKMHGRLVYVELRDGGNPCT